MVRLRGVESRTSSKSASDMAKVINCVVFTRCLHLSEPAVILPAEVLPCWHLLSPAFQAPMFRVEILNLISAIPSAINVYYVRLLEWGVAWLPFFKS